jgi:hypothetical protein
LVPIRPEGPRLAQPTTYWPGRTGLPGAETTRQKIAACDAIAVTVWEVGGTGYAVANQPTWRSRSAKLGDSPIWRWSGRRKTRNNLVGWIVSLLRENATTCLPAPYGRNFVPRIRSVSLRESRSSWWSKRLSLLWLLDHSRHRWACCAERRTVLVLPAILWVHW